jgi:hypothetical protein
MHDKATRAPAIFLAAGLALVAVPRPAAAQGRDPSAADALFRQAREAMSHGDVTTACSRFAESQRLDPAPGTLLNVAQCEERQGKIAASVAHLNDVIESLPKDDFRLGYARAQLAALRPRVPTVTVMLAKENATGVRVIRDDIELREASFGMPMPLDPGTHVFIVRAEGREDARERVMLREGQHVTLTLSVGHRSTAQRTPMPMPMPMPAGTDARWPLERLLSAARVWSPVSSRVSCLRTPRARIGIIATQAAATTMACPPPRGAKRSTWSAPLPSESVLSALVSVRISSSRRSERLFARACSTSALRLRRSSQG